jgi:hypothetical protein
MKRHAYLLIAFASIPLSMPSLAADKPGAFPAKPASFVPHPHSSHVYGSPIAPAVVGHAKTSHQKPAHRKSPPAK